MLGIYVQDVAREMSYGTSNVRIVHYIHTFYSFCVLLLESVHYLSPQRVRSYIEIFLCVGNGIGQPSKSFLSKENFSKKKTFRQKVSSRFSLSVIEYLYDLGEISCDREKASMI